MNSDQILESRTGAEFLSIEVDRQFSSDWSIAITGCFFSKEEFDNQIFAYYGIFYKNVNSDKIYLHPLTKAADAQEYFAEYTLTPTGMKSNRGQYCYYAKYYKGLRSVLSTSIMSLL